MNNNYCNRNNNQNIPKTTTIAICTATFVDIASVLQTTLEERSLQASSDHYFEHLLVEQ